MLKTYQKPEIEYLHIHASPYSGKTENIETVIDRPEFDDYGREQARRILTKLLYAARDAGRWTPIGWNHLLGGCLPFANAVPTINALVDAGYISVDRITVHTQTVRPDSLVEMRGDRRPPTVETEQVKYLIVRPTARLAYAFTREDQEIGDVLEAF